ncbi:MAG TPA: hypothetical protein VJI15_01040 [Candidatus Nanoarchaeia archaeon]|nr:hypothetical protein [Candidatus Nanoarchaeia archaeon]
MSLQEILHQRKITFVSIGLGKKGAFQADYEGLMVFLLRSNLGYAYLPDGRGTFIDMKQRYLC